MVYEPRQYRRRVNAPDLVSFEVVVAETDLQVLAQSALKEFALHSITCVRGELEGYIERHPRFYESYVPIDVEPAAPGIVREMCAAARAAGVGPMAAVAGAIAERVARDLSGRSGEVIVENGGDVYLIGKRPRTVGLWTGDEAPSGVAVEVGVGLLPTAVATSSGKIGHSVSFGEADSVTVIARSGALADAVASAGANRVRAAADVQGALDWMAAIEGVSGAVVSVSGALGAWGELRLVPAETR